jgi:hypothetical protein
MCLTTRLVGQPPTVGSADLSELPPAAGKRPVVVERVITIPPLGRLRSLALITRNFQLSVEVAKESSDRLIKKLCLILGG